MSENIFDYVIENNIEEVNLLLEYGADVNIKDEYVISARRKTQSL